MATRSRIAVEKDNGKVVSVYCHNDGYPDGVGTDLLHRFPNGTPTSEVLEFIMEGDRSTVDLSYREWRDEDSPPNYHANCDDFFAGDIEEYGYLYTREGEWVWKSCSGLMIDRLELI